MGMTTSELGEEEIR